MFIKSIRIQLMCERCKCMCVFVCLPTCCSIENLDSKSCIVNWLTQKISEEQKKSTHTNTLSDHATNRHLGDKFHVFTSFHNFNVTNFLWTVQIFWVNVFAVLNREHRMRHLTYIFSWLADGKRIILFRYWSKRLLSRPIRMHYTVPWFDTKPDSTACMHGYIDLLSIKRSLWNSIVSAHVCYQQWLLPLTRGSASKVTDTTHRRHTHTHQQYKKKWDCKFQQIVWMGLFI